MTLRRRPEGLVDATSCARRHALRADVGVRIRGHAADIRVAADANAVRADPDRHRGVDAAGLLPAARPLAARILTAAVIRPEHAAARESNRQRARRHRNLNRLRDDLVHSAPRFLVSLCLKDSWSFQPLGQIRLSSRRRTLCTIPFLLSVGKATKLKSCLTTHQLLKPTQQILMSLNTLESVARPLDAFCRSSAESFHLRNA